MSAVQPATFSPRNLVAFGVFLLIALILGEVVFNPHGVEEAMVKRVDTAEDIALRLKPVVTLDDIRSNMSASSAAADDASKTPDQLYQAACLACHTTGAAGAPKIGDAAAWAERIGKGLDALVSAAIGGIGAMPPRGGSQFSNDQMRAVVEYILAESQ